MRPNKLYISLFTGLISIHAPIVGCDSKYILDLIRDDIFQSTHPSWGATYKIVGSFFKEKNFNPRTHRGVRRPPCFWWCSSICYFNPRTHRGVRPVRILNYRLSPKISIHAPIVGCDFFQYCFLLLDQISIHAPIVGCDDDHNQ